MTNGKYKVSFEITNNWDIQGFRNFIKILLSDDAKYEVFLISNDDSSSLIQTVGANLNLDTDHIIICNFADDKLKAIKDRKIDIHLDNLQSFVMSVDNFTEDTYGILVTRYLNKYYLQPDYIIVFDRLLEKIKNEQT
jgi:hypothetical protein